MRDTVLVNNEIKSPFGAGWILDGLQRLHIQGENNLLITEGDGSALLFSKSQDLRFSDPTNFKVGGFAKSLAVGDFNGDSNPDIAVMDSLAETDNLGAGDGSGSILLGDGNGAFSEPISLPAVSRGLNSVAVGDFNGDGNLDIVVATTTALTGEVLIFLGDGTGTFSDHTSFLVGSVPTSVVVADFNGDNISDIATSNIFDGNVSILLGDGQGDFSQAANFSARVSSTSGPVSLTVGDFNADSNLDIAVANDIGQDVSVILGDGTGTFSAPTAFPVGGVADFIVADDFNDDGFLDLAATIRGLSIEEGVAILFGDGTGTFSDPINFPVGGDSPESMAVGNLNGDNILDLAVTNTSSDDVSILLGDSLRGFSDPINFEFDDLLVASGVGADRLVAISDFNGDGSFDLAVLTNPDPFFNNVVIFLNEPMEQNEFQGPPGDFSTLQENSDGTFTRAMKNGTKINFDKNGLQASVVDRNGNSTTYNYDADGLLVSITDPVGLETKLTYNNGLLSTVTDPAGRTTSFEHDGAGNLTSIIDPDDSSRQFDYDIRHRMISQTSKRGFITTYEYNFAGRITQANRSDGSTRHIAPSQTIGLADLANGLGTQDNPVPFVRPGNGVNPFKDGNGNITNFVTNSFGSPIEINDALGRKSVINRDGNNNREQVVTPNGSITRATYDEKGNLLMLVEAVGTSIERKTNFEYEPMFNLATLITGSDGKEITFDYDAKGNTTKITNPIDGAIIMTYNSRGLMLTRSDENKNTTQFIHDGNGNLSLVIDAKGNELRFTWDLAGNIVVVTESIDKAIEHTRSFTYDDLNRVLSDTDGAGLTTLFRYDEVGNLTEVEFVSGQVLRRAFDEMNRIISTEDPIDGITKISYDLNGNVVQQSNDLGSFMNFQYDAANQLIRVTDTLEGEMRFSYDEQGNVVSVETDRDQTTTFEYDLFNRLTQVTNPLGLSTILSYDSTDNLIAKIDPI